MARLFPKQKLFVQEYLVDLNATQAAIRAGYSKKTAYRTGADNLKKPQIQSALKAAMDDRSKRTEITQDMVLKEYAKIAFLDPRKFFDENGHLKQVKDLDDDTAASLAGMDIITKYIKNGDGDPEPEFIKKIKIADKLKALQDVGKHLGIFEQDNKQKGIPTQIIFTRKTRSGKE